MEELGLKMAMATAATTMKSILIYLIPIIFVSTSIFASDSNADQWTHVTTNVQMSIRTMEPEQKKGQPVKLIVSYKNVSTNDYSVSRANYIERDQTYSFGIISPSQTDISPDMRKIHEGISGGGFDLHPGQTHEVEFNLSELCKFDETGTYKIIAKKMIYYPPADKAFAVVSNPLLVKVVP